MNTKQKIGLGIITPAFILATLHTACSRPDTNKNITQNDSIQTKNVDIITQYENAQEAYVKGTLSADSFQNIKKKFEEEIKYVECGD